MRSILSNKGALLAKIINVMVLWAMEIIQSAMIMHGDTYDMGAVAYLKHHRQAISIARHTMLVGEGAEEFADAFHFPRQEVTTNSWFNEYTRQPNLYTNIPEARRWCWRPRPLDAARGHHSTGGVTLRNVVDNRVLLGRVRRLQVRAKSGISGKEKTQEQREAERADRVRFEKLTDEETKEFSCMQPGLDLVVLQVQVLATDVDARNEEGTSGDCTNSHCGNFNDKERA
eukprot:gene30095-36349_t